jgi:hypothetical protein
MNLLGQGTAERMRAKIVNAKNIRLCNAFGKEMTLVGQSYILVKILGLGRQDILTFLITLGLLREEQVLLGIRALETLKLLPVNWPANLDF